MNWLIIGATFDVLGKVLIGTTVLLVHGKVIKKHRISKAVIKEMKHERLLGLSGIVFIMIGYLIHVFSL